MKEVAYWFVPLDQPLGRLAAYVLEPECEDGLAACGFGGSGQGATAVSVRGKVAVAYPRT